MWQWFRYSLFVAFIGLFVIDTAWNGAVRWLVTGAATAILLWDRSLWLRSQRQRRRSADSA
jgi:hypothetical protein